MDRELTRVEVRALESADHAALRSLLVEDPWSGVYLLGMLHWFGIASPRSRFIGAFAGGRLVGAIAEAREVHCWYASLVAPDTATARTLGQTLVAPRSQVLLGREDLVQAALATLPPERVHHTTSLVLGVSHDDVPAEPPAHAVRRATPHDLPQLVDLYEPYEFDGYPTRRHVRRALAERIARSGIYVIDAEGRVVAARRIDASSPEVVLLGGLSVTPAWRGRRLGRSLRLACVEDLSRRGLRHCGLRHPHNPHAQEFEHRAHAPWTIANLSVPPPPAWRTLVGRVRARLSSWDRPCRRRRPDFTRR